ncbi:uncharacterized protein AB675_8822 [Cyphellophora attinorum]|uniref:Uncharacterized protein n=1 Tax=Cyphellophora attinorum TaxID=1664694 RepID=A0A0N0NQS8_9EURO|nr:uncharacterized protein AB675_8822 [Phialophora attinorum]KPI44271.1 hypothetical protein AB675_8822 [Phialophora attinorum]
MGSNQSVVAPAAAVLSQLAAAARGRPNLSDSQSIRPTRAPTFPPPVRHKILKYNVAPKKLGDMKIEVGHILLLEDLETLLSDQWRMEILKLYLDGLSTRHGWVEEHPSTGITPNSGNPLLEIICNKERLYLVISVDEDGFWAVPLFDLDLLATTANSKCHHIGLVNDVHEAERHRDPMLCVEVAAQQIHAFSPGCSVRYMQERYFQNVGFGTLVALIDEKSCKYLQELRLREIGRSTLHDKDKTSRAEQLMNAHTVIIRANEQSHLAGRIERNWEAVRGIEAVRPKSRPAMKEPKKSSQPRASKLEITTLPDPQRPAINGKSDSDEARNASGSVSTDTFASNINHAENAHQAATSPNNTFGTHDAVGPEVVMPAEDEDLLEEGIFDEGVMKDRAPTEGGKLTAAQMINHLHSRDQRRSDMLRSRQHLFEEGPEASLRGTTPGPRSRNGSMTTEDTKIVTLGR